MADVPKLIEREETTPLARETGPAMPIKAIEDPAREPESEKVAEKVPERPKMMAIALLKLSATTGTSRKRRMPSILDTVLESVKTSPPSSAEASGSKIKDATEMITASTSAHAEAKPSEFAPENLVEESLPKNPRHPLPKHLPRVI
jgi:hypothetical protein